MSHLFSLSPKSHTRHSHHLQADSALPPPPPSSFARSSGTGIKSSLKKIPSSLFTHNKHPADDKPLATGKGMAKPTKPRNKTRKALADIFAWGHSHSANTASYPVEKAVYIPKVPSTASDKAQAPPMPPAKDARPATVLRKAASRGFSATKPSLATLRPPAAQAPQDSRPSMGDDPFSRRAEGAEVVNLVQRYSASVRSSAAADRRSSVSSGKALSGKTLYSEVGSEKENRNSKSSSNAPGPNQGETPKPRHVSSPLPSDSRKILSDLPPRSASLGRLIGSNPVQAARIAISPPRPLVPKQQQIVDPFAASGADKRTPTSSIRKLSPKKLLVTARAAVQDEKGLKREKTKSKVWGFLGMGKKVDKVEKGKLGRTDEAVVMGDEQAGRIEEIKTRARTIRSVSSQATGTNTVRSRPRPPILHLTQPSVDQPLAQLTSSTIISAPYRSRLEHDSPFVPSPIESPSRETGGVWESVVGSLADRSLHDRPKDAVVAALGGGASKGVPKRKSLSGLFGLAIKRSMDKIKNNSPPRNEIRPGGEEKRGMGTLRSLAEELEEMEDSPMFAVKQPSPPYRSRFGDAAHRPAPLDLSRKDEVLGADGLTTVATATDKLSALLTQGDWSPFSSPAVSRRQSLAAMASLQSLRASPTASPTPFRRARSALLSNKPSPVKQSARISPLKLALHRKQVKARVPSPTNTPTLSKAEGSTSEAGKKSLVKKGMKNIFAPPSPLARRGAGAQEREDESGSPDVDSMRPTKGQLVVESKQQVSNAVSDVPHDLLQVIGPEIDIDTAGLGQPPSPTQASGGQTNTLGLPLPPPIDRISLRRPALPPPTLTVHSIADENEGIPQRRDRISPIAPQISMGIIKRASTDPRDSVFSDVLLGPDMANNRDSFDFTDEYAKLDQGDQRASFVEALHKVQSVSHLVVDLPPLPPLPDDLATRTPVGEKGKFLEAPSHSPMDVPTIRKQRPSHSPSHTGGSQRKAPFQGQAAFQQRISEVKEQNPQAFSFPAPPLALPAVPPPPLPVAALPQQASDFLVAPAERGRCRAHRRDESGFSIASMSSIGEVIETGIAGDYTNYFEVNFAEHLSKQQQLQHHGEHIRAGSVNSSRHSNSGEMSGVRNVMSRSSMVSTASQPKRHHHRRSSSILSVESLGELQLVYPHNGLPPVSMRNAKRSSYVSKHRRVGSGESAFGRTDWASHHRRNTSADSAVSVVSVSRIVRPGLGDRMFQLDGGVQLTSITGSPPDDATSSGQWQRHSRMQSWESDAKNPRDESASIKQQQDGRERSGSSFNDDSIFDTSDTPSFVDSIFDASANRSSASGDSLFGAGETNTFGGAHKREPSDFMIKGLRPVSLVSTVSNGSEGVHMDDTFINVARYGRRTTQTRFSTSPRRAEEAEVCLQGEGEDTSFASTEATRGHEQSDKSSDTARRQLLASSIARPAKPKRRPANLIFTHPNNSITPSIGDTPGLTSPSASEASSRVSLETRFSADLPSFRRGHVRQKSSAQVKVEATIKEEPSMATLRGWDGPREQEETRKLRAVKSWMKLQREADDECRRVRSEWVDSEESRVAIAEFKLPSTSDEIAAFLARSSQAYKPLEQLPLGKSLHHRRKSSLSESRLLMSPYGLPLPKPPSHSQQQPKKASLLTKFERTNSATSSAFSIEVEPTFITPATAGFPLSSKFAQFARETPPSPPPTIAHPSFSPIQLPKFDAFGRGDGSENSSEKMSQRARVTSQARRQALGWGRRRNSDGPAKVIPSGASTHGAMTMGRMSDGPARVEEALDRAARILQPAFISANSHRPSSQIQSGGRSDKPGAVKQAVHKIEQGKKEGVSKAPVPAFGLGGGLEGKHALVKRSTASRDKENASANNSSRPPQIKSKASASRKAASRMPSRPRGLRA